MRCQRSTQGLPSLRFLFTQLFSADRLATEMHKSFLQASRKYYEPNKLSLSAAHEPASGVVRSCSQVILAGSVRASDHGNSQSLSMPFMPCCVMNDVALGHGCTRGEKTWRTRASQTKIEIGASVTASVATTV